MARIGAFAHRYNNNDFFNFLRHFLDQLLEFKFTSPNESTSLTEAKTRSDYDVIDGNESGADVIDQPIVRAGN